MTPEEMLQLLGDTPQPEQSGGGGMSPEMMVSLLESGDVASPFAPDKEKYNPDQSLAGYAWDQAKGLGGSVAGTLADTLWNARDLLKVGAATPWWLNAAAEKTGLGTKAEDLMAHYLPSDERKGPAKVPPPPAWLDVSAPDPNATGVDQVAQALALGRPGGGQDWGKAFGAENLRAPSQGIEDTAKVAKMLSLAIAAHKIPLPGKPGGMTLPQAVLTGTGAGLGQIAAEHTFPDSNLASVAGGLLGGVTPSIVPSWMEVSPTLQLARATVSPTAREAFSKKYASIVDPIIKKTVQNQLASELAGNPSALKNIEQSRELMAAVPGVKMDVGQASQVPSLIQQSKGAVTSTPHALDAKVALDEANRDLIARQLAPSTIASDLGATASKAVGATTERMSAIDKIAEALQSGRKQTAETFPRANQEQLGKTARGLREGEKSAADVTVKAMLDDAEKSATGKKFDVTDVVASVEEASNDPIFKYAPESRPKIMGRIDALKTGPQSEPSLLERGPGAAPKTAPNVNSVDFKELRSMREAVNEDLRDASGPTTRDRQMRRQLNAIKNKIDDAILAGGGDVAQKYGAFVEHYRDVYAPRFLRGVNIKQTLKDNTGVERIADEKLFDQYFRPDSPRTAKQYLSLYGNNADGKRLMHEAVLDRYAREVIGQRGEIMPARHAAFMARYRSSLQALKDGGINVADELSNVGNAETSVFNRIAALTEERKALANDAFTKAVTDKLGVKNTDQIMQGVVKDPRQADLVISKLDREGAEGMVDWFGRQLAETAKAGSAADLTGELSARLSDKNWLYAFRTALEKSGGKASADAHIAKLKTLNELARRLGTTEANPQAGTVQPGRFDSLASKIGISPRSIWSLTRAIVTGRSSESDAALVIGGQISTRQIELARARIFNDIMSNPQALDDVIAIAKSGSPQDTGAQAALKNLAHTTLRDLPSAMKRGAKAVGKGIAKDAARPIVPVAVLNANSKEQDNGP
jgi:hypothetical protein